MHTTVLLYDCLDDFIVRISGSACSCSGINDDDDDDDDDDENDDGDAAYLGTVDNGFK